MLKKTKNIKASTTNRKLKMFKTNHVSSLHLFTEKCTIAAVTAITTLYVERFLHPEPDYIYKITSPSIVSISSIDFKQDPFAPRTLMEYNVGSGTGFVYKDSYYVVTNAHVIQQATEVKVNDNDAKIIGVDKQLDIALLYVEDQTNFKPLEPCDTTPKVGTQVLALGNPFGFTKTLTSGIISATDRVLESDNHSPLIHLIQTDAAINPGNSGGPLLEARSGCVLGMNTAIVSPSGSSSGIGFAIPINTIESIVNDIINDTGKENVQLGVTLLPDEYTIGLGIDGVIIADVLPGSVAETYGIKGTYRDEYGRPFLGDIIIEINGKRIQKRSDIYVELGSLRKGDTIELSILRSTKIESLNIKF